MVLSSPLFDMKSIVASVQRNLRFVHSSSPRLDSSKKGSEVGHANQAPKSNPVGNLGNRPMTVPTFLDKKFLVWAGKYKSVAEIPKQVDGEVIHRVRSWSRIRINLGFLFLAALGGGIMVLSGKRAAARGESIERQNLEWHRKNKEDYDSGRK